MNAAFYTAAVIAVLATGMAVTRYNAVHALLYLIVSLISVALIFFVLGAPFVSALEVIIYAGAIMVLFVFVVMMLKLGPSAVEQETRWLTPGVWLGPAFLSLILLGLLIYILVRNEPLEMGTQRVVPHDVGMSLFGPYLLGVELASMLLMAGLVGAHHLGQNLGMRE